MAKTQHEIMTVDDLINLLARLKANKQVKGDTKITLSSDEEGNEFLPMLKDTSCSLGIEKGGKEITFYPCHI